MRLEWQQVVPALSAGLCLLCRSGFLNWAKSPAARQYFFSGSRPGGRGGVEELTTVNPQALTSGDRCGGRNDRLHVRGLTAARGSPQVANWGLPIAAISDLRKDEEMISGVMSPTLAGYSWVRPATTSVSLRSC